MVVYSIARVIQWQSEFVKAIADDQDNNTYCQRCRAAVLTVVSLQTMRQFWKAVIDSKT